MREYLHKVLGVWIVRSILWDLPYGESSLKPIHVQLPLTPIGALILTSCVLNVVLMQFDLIFNGSNLINGSVNKEVKLWPPTGTDRSNSRLLGEVNLCVLKQSLTLRIYDKMPKHPK